MNLTPEAIDGLTTQLKFAFEHAENLPEEVRVAGAKFIEALDNWSENMKASALKA